MNKKTNEDWKNAFSNKLNVLIGLMVVVVVVLVGICIWVRRNLHPTANNVNETLQDPSELIKKTMKAIVSEHENKIMVAKSVGFAVSGFMLTIATLAAYGGYEYPGSQLFLWGGLAIWVVSSVVLAIVLYSCSQPNDSSKVKSRPKPRP